MMFTLAAIVLIAAGLTPLILRDLRRAVARRRMQRKLAPLRAAFLAMQTTVGVALIPSMAAAVRAAADMDETMRKINDVMKQAGRFTPSTGGREDAR